MSHAGSWIPLLHTSQVMAEAISTHVNRCLPLFRSFVDPQDESNLNSPDPGVLLQMVDEQSRFRVWSGNLGAHRVGTSSLDYRLRDASHLKSQIINLLEDLAQLLADALAITKGEQKPWDQEPEDSDDGTAGISDLDDGLPGTELGQIARGVTDIVNCLLSLAVAVRNPAPHNRHVKAKSANTSHFEVYDIGHVRSKFVNVEPWLASRLGTAISRRRQYFKYRESHHQKLSHGLEEDAKLEAETIASSLPCHLKGGHAGSSPVFEDDSSDTGVSMTSYDSVATKSGGLAVPALPEEAYSGPFQCCFCYMMVATRDRATWK